MTAIRKVTPDDAAAIAEIYNRYITDTTISFETSPLTARQMAARIAEISSECPYLVAETNGEISGYCYAHPWKERAAYSATLETTVYLRPDDAGKGIGRMLMNRLIEECRIRGVHALIACITADNAASCAFHEQLGFTRSSEFKEVGRKFDKWLDVVDYQLIL